MRLAPSIRLLQAPLGGWVVPRAHISAKPAKTPTSAPVSTSEAAGVGRGGPEVFLGGDFRVGHGGDRTCPGLELLEGVLRLGVSPMAGTESQLQEKGPCSHRLQVSVPKQPAVSQGDGAPVPRTPSHSTK